MKTGPIPAKLPRPSDACASAVYGNTQDSSSRPQVALSAKYQEIGKVPPTVPNQEDAQMKATHAQEEDGSAEAVVQGGEDEDCTAQLLLSPTTTGGRPRSVQFPWKLHQILEYCHKHPALAENVMSWDKNGKTFQIHNKARFEAEIMRRFFESNRFKSFQRSLNLWGFYVRNRGVRGRSKTLGEADDTGLVHAAHPSHDQSGRCYHPLFIRGQPELCLGMKRIKKKTNKKRTPNKQKSTSHLRSIGVTSKIPHDLGRSKAIRGILMGATETTTALSHPIPSSMAFTASPSFLVHHPQQQLWLQSMLPSSLPSGLAGIPSSSAAPLASGQKSPMLSITANLLASQTTPEMKKALFDILAANHTSNCAFGRASAATLFHPEGRSSLSEQLFMMDGRNSVHTFPAQGLHDARLLLDLASPPSTATTDPSLTWRRYFSNAGQGIDSSFSSQVFSALQLASAATAVEDLTHRSLLLELLQHHQLGGGKYYTPS